LIQQTGWGLLTLAISQGTVNRHLAALAAPNPRKLALLVGIDQYGANIPPLPVVLPMWSYKKTFSVIVLVFRMLI